MKEKGDLKPLLTRLLSLGFEEVECSDEGLIIQRLFDRVYRGYRVPVKYRVEEKHLKFIQDEKRLEKEYKQFKPCWIIGTDYAELLIHSSGNFSKHLLEQAISEWGRITFGSEPGAVIGKASEDFIGFFRFDPDFISFQGNQRPEEIVKTCDLTAFYEPPLTIRISRPKDIKFSEEYVTSIADTCLFHLADLSHISLKLASEWESSGEQLIFSQNGIRPPENLEIPKSLASRELVNFYTRALNGTVPEYQFLGFYHCLEHFFLTVSDQVLYQRVKTHLLSPAFAVTNQYIDKVIFEIQKHRSEENEIVMLRQVLQQYISAIELKNFIGEFENWREVRIYTENREILGKQFQIDPASKNVFEALAQRIKHIRNEIVHSEDRRQRSKQRWLDLDSVAVDELPLMRFLAQQVIIATSNPIEELDKST